MDTVYSKTLSNLETYGWCQVGESTECGTGTGRKASGERCLEWALADVTPTPALMGFYLSTMKDHLGLADNVDLWQWNDHPSTTFADVKGLLVSMHEKAVRAMEIGEPIREIEFEPIPESAPVEEPTPVEAPEPEGVPV